MADLSLLPPSAAIEGGDLRIGGCLLSEVAERFGTPAYVIDEHALRDRAREYLDAVSSRHPRSRVCFAVKAYPSVAMIRVLVDAGLGCDVVGAGELRFALAAGADPATIGVSPGVESATHAALATGGKRSKFGVPVEQVPAAVARMRAVPAIDLRGLHAHIGSQILAVDQFEAAVDALASLERFEVYDFGGGLGVRYEPQDVAPSVDDYAERLVGAAHKHLGEDIELLVEPGRSMVARAGLTLYRVVTVKQAGRLHVAVDGGMGDNLEHSLYGQRFSPLVVGRWDAEPVVADLVGRHCESGDVITPDVALADPRIGDLIVVPVTGAYCFTMANNYNAALRPPVIFCANGTARVGVRRETFDDLLAREVV